MLSLIPSDLICTARAMLAATALAAVALPQAQAVAVSGQGTWQTTLKGRDLDGNSATLEAFYDTTLNITWLADANFAKTSGYDADGHMTWAAAKTWAAQLNFNGITGWRLPDTKPVSGGNFFNTDIAEDGSTDNGHNITSTQSELSHLYYVTLGDKGRFNTLGNFDSNYGLINTGPLNNIQSYSYWTGKEIIPDTSVAFYFNTDGGFQNYIGTVNTFPVPEYFAWAVHSGDVGVAVVPEPSTYALMGLGLAALAVVRKRQHR
jgi:PEP-CTERM motif